MPTIAGGNRGDCNEAAQLMRAKEARNEAATEARGGAAGRPPSGFLFPRTKHSVPSIVASDDDNVSNTAANSRGELQCESWF
jgi:hypothetical protein